MSYAFETAPGAWLEIAENGTTVPGGGELGEDVTLSHGFLDSLSPETRAERGFVEVVETDPPEGWIGWTVEDVEGAPTRVWQTEV